MRIRSRNYLDSLTGLRGLAAVYIFMYHYGCEDLGAPEARLASNGRVAVSLAFVLSGFIMIHSHSHCEMEPDTGCRSHFWLKRLVRIMPCYFFALLLNFNDLRPLFSNNERNPITNAYLDWSWVDILTQFLGISSWLPWSPSLPWNSVSWAVQTQLGFYFMFPFLHSMHRYIIQKRGWRGWVELLLCYTFLSVLIPSIASFVAPSALRSSFPLHSPAVRCQEFALGMLFGFLHKSIVGLAASQAVASGNSSVHFPSSYRSSSTDSSPDSGRDAAEASHRPPSNRNVSLIQPIPPSFVQITQLLQRRCDQFYLGGLFVIFALGLNHAAAEWCANGGIALLLAIMIYALASSETSSDQSHGKLIVRLLSTRPLMKMGSISYAFYLIHMCWPPLLTSIGYHLPSKKTPSSSTTSLSSSESDIPLVQATPTLAYFFLSVGAAILILNLIERPLYADGKRLLRKWNITCECSSSEISFLGLDADQQSPSTSSANVLSREEFAEEDEQMTPYQSNFEEDVIFHT